MFDIFVVLMINRLNFVLLSVEFLAFSDYISDSLYYALQQLNHKPQNLKQAADKHSEHDHEPDDFDTVRDLAQRVLIKITGTFRNLLQYPECNVANLEHDPEEYVEPVENFLVQRLI